VFIEHRTECKLGINNYLEEEEAVFGGNQLNILSFPNNYGLSVKRGTFCEWIFNYFHAISLSLFQVEVARFKFPKTTLIAVVNKAQTTAKKRTRKRYHERNMNTSCQKFF
jgi:hypothetical protein